MMEFKFDCTLSSLLQQLGTLDMHLKPEQGLVVHKSL